LAHLIELAIEERRDDFRDSGFQRELCAMSIGSQLAKLTGLELARCETAAKETLLGSHARLVIDQIVNYARYLRAELEHSSPQKVQVA
jgi:hypothetical protein